ncbi:hypothetical protein [Roseovarius sp. Pro17]|uniref:hypothetical protein n=1 Tax=Roseovarius sp. Pro17 TaxID=3108175 RepID=UPI002D77D52A|nr:hypothetical protein [Roseovarius sp. Pro17]
MKRCLPLSLLAVMTLTACAGRDPNPVNEIQDGDARLSCPELRREIDVNSQAVRGLIDEKRDKQTQNVVAGAAGAILFFPALFFMDLKGASAEEARAYQRRNQGLVSRYNARGCSPAIAIQTYEPAKAAAEAKRTKKKPLAGKDPSN